ncbi:MAG TPA: acyl-CoA dehydrogenase [Mycobacteriales bacterium]|jgi:alkylation response protein AidB-like acyl-CoA dehydrogenase|nr:acyl-CoA dehydrogenase [Mycobacteriales bacterium]
MDFSLTEEQLELRRMLRDVTADRVSSGQLREAIETPTGEDSALWQLLVGELGLLGVAVGEASGGIGGSFVDAAVVIEESGRGLWPAPMLSALVAVAALGGEDGSELLQAVVAGDWRAALVVADDCSTSGTTLSGRADHVIGAAGAEVLVVASPDGLYALQAAAVATASGLDPARRLSTVSFAGAAAQRLGDAEKSRRAVDVMRVALAVESVGVAAWCLDTTVAYLKTREQFGRPIGSFQALAHRAADLAVELSAATSTAYYAAWAVDGASAELAVVAPLAKAVCTDAAYRIAADAIQLHGGIGFTWEHDVHLYFKRATANRLLLGDTHAQRELVATRAGLFA